MKRYRVLVYDANDQSNLLDESWRLGSKIAKTFGRYNETYGVRTLNEMFDVLLKPRMIDEVHYWGHGGPGYFLVGRERLEKDSHDEYLTSLSALINPGGLVWIRTCSSFSTFSGLCFAEYLAKIINCRVSSQTYKIGLLHSGIHSLKPNCVPSWSMNEGNILKEGTVKLLGSSLFRKHTLFCLESRLPDDW